MRKKLILTIILIALAVLPVYAKEDIKISLEQTEFYFQIGEKAIVPITTENTYSSEVAGTLSYHVTQNINNAGMRVSTSNTNASSMEIPKGTEKIGLNFGTADKPTTFTVGMSFQYNDGNENRIVELDDVKIYFVRDKSNFKNQKNSVSSSSKKMQGGSGGQSNDPFANDPFFNNSRSMMKRQMDEMNRMDEEFNRMFNNMQSRSRSRMGQSQNRGNIKKRLQNGQIKQDSDALKKQMQKQLNEQKKLKEEFQKNIAKDPQFQKKHDELEKKGFKLDKENVTPKSKDTGSFDMKYKNDKGESMNVKGKMNKGKMENMQSMGSQEKKKMMENLQKNKEFGKLKKELEKSGFKQQETKFDKKGDKTTARTEFKNEEGKKATVKSEHDKKGEVKKVAIEGEKPEELKKKPPYWILGVIAVAGILAYFLLRKYLKKKDEKEEKVMVEEKPIDYTDESLKLLHQAKIFYEDKKFKDAYSSVGRAMRLYLSRKNGMTDEMTNDEIVKYMKKAHRTNGKVKECFDLCSLVEFAKYQANDEDFEKIISIAGETIKKDGQTAGQSSSRT